MSTHAAWRYTSSPTIACLVECMKLWRSWISGQVFFIEDVLRGRLGLVCAPPQLPLMTAKASVNTSCSHTAQTGGWWCGGRHVGPGALADTSLTLKGQIVALSVLYYLLYSHMEKLTFSLCSGTLWFCCPFFFFFFSKFNDHCSWWIEFLARVFRCNQHPVVGDVWFGCLSRVYSTSRLQFFLQPEGLPLSLQV